MVDYSTQLSKVITKVFDKDKMTVHRHVDVTNDDGIVIDEQLIPIHIDISCHLSFSSRDTSNKKNEYVNEKSTTTNVYYNDYDIQKGDFIEVIKAGKVWKGKAGEPNTYQGRRYFQLEDITNE